MWGFCVGVSRCLYYLHSLYPPAVYFTYPSLFLYKVQIPDLGYAYPIPQLCVTQYCFDRTGVLCENSRNAVACPIEKNTISLSRLAVTNAAYEERGTTLRKKKVYEFVNKGRLLSPKLVEKYLYFCVHDSRCILCGNGSFNFDHF